MSIVSILSVNVVDNPCSFFNTVQFEISFESEVDLEHDLEWKITYVSSAEKSEYDQVLDSVQLGPIQKGVSKFLFQAPAPDPEQIPSDDILGVTVIYLSCLYQEKEFSRVGFFVRNEYTEEFKEQHKEELPETPNVENIQRYILTTKPRITKWTIDWD
eukprot:TRINITY_DN8588_c0_g1_i1.p1 TRINITY_DN8588_c0_g1~~TRINITY_DN8588_c0_g1_i1.p1  ORF type:complete len:158 (+),score=42.79 TRINITY_DN8588_c0_g1_i1:78-551(+)